MATSSTIRSLSRRFRTAVLWAMVPLAAIGGRPVLGCVCSDGSYKIACPMLREAQRQRHCNCCQAPSAGHRVHHPVDHRHHESTADCCHARHKTEELSLSRAKCCHPVVQIPVLPPLGDVVSLNETDQRIDVAAPVEADSLSGVCHHVSVDDDTGRPAPDLVVTLRRLLI